jgi:hypothetical protein
MDVTVSPDVEKSLLVLAAQRSVDPAVLGGALLEEVMREKGLLPQTNGSEDIVPEDPGALARAVAAMVNRTPEQIEAAQEMALREFQSERELPPGKTIFDVVCGKWPGNETDEEVYQALKRLS